MILKAEGLNDQGSIIVLGCKKCGKCDGICETGALTRNDGIARVDNEKCNRCMRCIKACPNKAIIYLD